MFMAWRLNLATRSGRQYHRNLSPHHRRRSRLSRRGIFSVTLERVFERLAAIPETTDRMCGDSHRIQKPTSKQSKAQNSAGLVTLEKCVQYVAQEFLIATPIRFLIPPLANPRGVFANVPIALPQRLRESGVSRFARICCQ